MVVMRIFGIVAGLLLSVALAGCGGEGTSTSCDLNSCTITFDRGVEAKANVLGIEVKLVKVEGQNVTLDVAGNEVTAPVGQAVDVEGFQVKVDKVTDSEVEVTISQGGEG